SRMAQAYRIRSHASDQQRGSRRLKEIDERVADAHRCGESEYEIGGHAAEQCTARNYTPTMARRNEEKACQQSTRRPHGAHARGHIEREPKRTQGEVSGGHPERNSDLVDKALAGGGHCSK